MANTINMVTPKMTEWSNYDKLHMNINNTVAIFFHTRQRIVKIDENLLKINGDKIYTRKVLGRHH